LLASTADFQNPERGFYVWLTASEMASPSTINHFANVYNTRLFLHNGRLDAYRSQALPQSYLDSLNAGFASVRSAGAKLILRFVYNYDSSGADAPLSIVQQHLSQLKPVLAANADVIAYIQAGLIGSWGEGHSSQNGLDTPANKAAVRDAWLAAAPSNLSIAFQNADVRNWGGMARISAKNDCFLASNDDEYNFPGGLTSPLRDYMKAHNVNSPYGGETCSDASKGTTEVRLGCTPILSEGAAYKFSYLHHTWSSLFRDSWKAGGCFDQVSRSIGYRFQLDSVSHPTMAAPGTTANVSITLRNVGWSKIFSARKLVVTLRNKTTGALVSASAGNLKDIAAGASATINVPVNVATAGDYDVLISAPDIYPTTAGDARYAVRFGNADNASAGQAWEAGTARFNTGSTLRVQ
jgi:Domain of unknown function (DUF4874)/Domain of unknown function (DUF4832)